MGVGERRRAGDCSSSRLATALNGSEETAVFVSWGNVAADCAVAWPDAAAQGLAQRQDILPGPACFPSNPLLPLAADSAVIDRR